MKGEARVVTGLVRLAFCHVFEPRLNDDGSKGKYGVCLIIPKGDKETVQCIKKAVEAAKARGVRELWHNKLPSKLALPLQDGDDRDDAREEFAGAYYMNAKSKNRPGVVDKHLAPILDEEELYSGCWAVVSLSFFPYQANGNNGVAAGLDNIMKVKDDESFSGKPDAGSDFAGIEADDDDDL